MPRIPHSCQIMLTSCCSVHFCLCSDVLLRIVVSWLEVIVGSRQSSCVLSCVITWIVNILSTPLAIKVTWLVSLRSVGSIGVSEDCGLIRGSLCGYRWLFWFGLFVFSLWDGVVGWQLGFFFWNLMGIGLSNCLLMVIWLLLTGKVVRHVFLSMLSESWRRTV